MPATIYTGMLTRSRSPIYHPDRRALSSRSTRHTFEAIAKEWLARQTFTAKTRTKAEWMIHDLVVPYIGSRPISELTAPEILAVLRRIEARGRLETCHRAKWRIGQIIRYGRVHGPRVA